MLSRGKCTDVDMLLDTVTRSRMLKLPLQCGMGEAREPREQRVLDTRSAALQGFLAAIVLTTMTEVQLDSLVEGL